MFFCTGNRSFIARVYVSVAMKTSLFLACVLVTSVGVNYGAEEATIKGEKEKGEKAIVEHRHRGHRNEEFSVAPDAKIHVGDNKNATLADLKAGTVVHIAFTEEKGARTAHHISDMAPKPTEAKEGEKPKVHNGEKHMHGVLESVNVAASTIRVRAERAK